MMICEVYTMGSGDYRIYEAEFDCVEACFLYDEEILEEIVQYFDCDIETAEDLLQGRESAYDQCEATEEASEAAWWLQQKRGQCGKRMGYDGCEDRDEQGPVYIIPIFHR